MLYYTQKKIKKDFNYNVFLPYAGWPTYIWHWFAYRKFAGHINTHSTSPVAVAFTELVPIYAFIFSSIPEVALFWPKANEVVVLVAMKNTNNRLGETTRNALFIITHIFLFLKILTKVEQENANQQPMSSCIRFKIELEKNKYPVLYLEFKFLKL